MTFPRFIFLSLVMLGLLGSPFLAHAGLLPSPLVPCGITSIGQADCTVCDLFKLIKNSIDLILFGLVPIGGTLLFVIAGVYILFSGPVPANYATGIRIMRETATGIFIVGIAWLLTNTFIRTVMADQNIAQSWWQFTCKETIVTGTPGVTVSPTPPGQTVPPGTTVCAPYNVCTNVVKNSCGAQAACGQYAGWIAQYGGADTALLKAIIAVESSCNVRAVSSPTPPKDPAYGLMQLQVETAQQHAATCGVSKDIITGSWLIDPANAEKTICIGAAYVRSLKAGTCGSDPDNIAAGYNGGSLRCGPSKDCANETSCTQGGGPKRQWECFYDNPEHTKCNTGLDESRTYAGKISYCITNPGF